MKEKEISDEGAIIQRLKWFGRINGSQELRKTGFEAA